MTIIGCPLTSSIGCPLTSSDMHMKTILPPNFSIFSSFSSSDKFSQSNGNFVQSTLNGVLSLSKRYPLFDTHVAIIWLTSKHCVILELLNVLSHEKILISSFLERSCLSLSANFTRLLFSFIDLI